MVAMWDYFYLQCVTKRDCGKKVTVTEALIYMCLGQRGENVKEGFADGACGYM